MKGATPWIGDSRSSLEGEGDFTDVPPAVPFIIPPPVRDIAPRIPLAPPLKWPKELELLKREGAPLLGR